MALLGALLDREPDVTEPARLPAGYFRNSTLRATIVVGQPNQAARLLDAVPVAQLAACVPVGIAALSYAGTLAVAVAVAVVDLDVLGAAIARGVAAPTAARTVEGDHLTPRRRHPRADRGPGHVAAAPGLHA